MPNSVPVTIVVACNSANSPSYAWIELTPERGQRLAAIASLVRRGWGHANFSLKVPSDVSGWAEFDADLMAVTLHVSAQAFWYTATPSYVPSYGGNEVVTQAISFSTLEAALATPRLSSADYKWVGDVLFIGGCNQSPDDLIGLYYSEVAAC